MELIDFLKDDYLNALRVQMNAPLLDFTDLPFRNGITYAEVFDIYDGIDVDINEIEISTSGLLYYKGILVSLNIQDAFQRSENEENLPKLHICDCQKIKDMKTAGRIQRYISSGRSDRRRKIRFISNHKYISKIDNFDLDVCKYCLAQLEWNGYHSGMSLAEKNQMARNFDLIEFYQKFEPQFYKELISILYTDQDKVPLNTYQHDWVYLSYEFRKSKNWHCESCGRDCRGNHFDLHAHHINGNKADNNRKNLSALCFDCHASQPMHEHMRK